MKMICELKIIDPKTGVDFFGDFSMDAADWDEELGAFVMEEDDLRWWEQVTSECQKAYDALHEYYQETGEFLVVDISDFELWPGYVFDALPEEYRERYQY